MRRAMPATGLSFAPVPARPKRVSTPATLATPGGLRFPRLCTSASTGPAGPHVAWGVQAARAVRLEPVALGVPSGRVGQPEPAALAEGEDPRELAVWEGLREEAGPWAEREVPVAQQVVLAVAVPQGPVVQPVVLGVAVPQVPADSAKTPVPPVA